MNKKLLAIYLNDHLAGAALGFDLAKRSLKQNELGSNISGRRTRKSRLREGRA